MEREDDALSLISHRVLTDTIVGDSDVQSRQDIIDDSSGGVRVIVSFLSTMTVDDRITSSARKPPPN